MTDPCSVIEGDPADDDGQPRTEGAYRNLGLSDAIDRERRTVADRYARVRSRG